MTRRRQALPMMTVRVMTMRTHGLAASAERPIQDLLKYFGFSVRFVRLGTTLLKNVWGLMDVLQKRWTSGAAGLAILPWTDLGCRSCGHLASSISKERFCVKHGSQVKR